MGGSDLYCVGRVRLEHCTFVETGTQRSNVSVGRMCGGPGGSVTMDHCVFVGCGSAATIEVLETGTLILKNSVLAFGGQPGGSVTPIRCAGAPAELIVGCTDIYGNQGGDWVGCVSGMEATGGNLSADPLFCDRTAGNFGLQTGSPCASETTHQCGLIGVLGVVCGPTAVEAASWGAIKALYR
jgi:hypothetical protein